MVVIEGYCPKTLSSGNRPVDPWIVCIHVAIDEEFIGEGWFENETTVFGPF
jgi:hypothetical protein